MGGIAPGDDIEKEKGGFVHTSCARPRPDAPGQGMLFDAEPLSGMETRHDERR